MTVFFTPVQGIYIYLYESGGGGGVCVNKYTHEGLNARYEVFTVVLQRIWFLWVVMQCHCVSGFWRLYIYSSKDAVSRPKRIECLS